MAWSTVARGPGLRRLRDRCATIQQTCHPSFLAPGSGFVFRFGPEPEHANGNTKEREHEHGTQDRNAEPRIRMKIETTYTPEHMVDTVCPLDCPDSCSLEVTLRNGRITNIDGSTLNPVTHGFICAKVRRFSERVYGPDRLMYPAVRKGPKGLARFERVSWDEALERIADAMNVARDRFGSESVLPYSYGGSNGLLTQDTSDATLFRRLGASRLARTVCAAPTGAANMALYGKMPSVVYEDFAEAKVIVIWGANPSASGIHLVPYIREAKRRGARLVVID